MTAPALVSCLMVTRNRARLARRAVECFAAQTWPAKELVIVDDGTDSYEPMLAPFRRGWAIRYQRVAAEPGRRLGALRNLTFDLAAGDYCAQWDDDDWYHRDRLAVQMRAIDAQDLDAAVFKSTLMHVSVPPFVEHPYRAELGRGTPGTILHRRTALRYPNLPRREDTVFRRELGRTMRVGIVDGDHSHLFIRCFHGANTWERGHFEQRLHRTLRDRWHYVVAKYVHRDLRKHPRFRLTALERAAAMEFLRQSRDLGLLPS